MAACENQLENLSRLLDGELSPEDEDAVQAHRAACEACAAAHEELRANRELLRNLPPPEPTADFERHLFDKVRGSRAPGLARPGVAHRHPFLVAGGSSVIAATAAVVITVALLAPPTDGAPRDAWTSIADGGGGGASPFDGPLVPAAPLSQELIAHPVTQQLGDHAHDTYVVAKGINHREESDPARAVSLIEFDLAESSLAAETNELLDRVRDPELSSTAPALATFLERLGGAETFGEDGSVEHYLATTRDVLGDIEVALRAPDRDPAAKLTAIRSAARRGRLIERAGLVQAMLLPATASRWTLRSGNVTVDQMGPLPDDAVAIYKVAKRKLFNHEPEVAVAILRQLAERLPDGDDLHAEIDFVMADVLHRGGQVAEARRLYDSIDNHWIHPGDPIRFVIVTETGGTAAFFGADVDVRLETAPDDRSGGRIRRAIRIGPPGAPGGLHRHQMRWHQAWETDEEHVVIVAPDGHDRPARFASPVLPSGSSGSSGARRIDRIVLNGESFDLRELADDAADVEAAARELETFVLELVESAGVGEVHLEVLRTDDGTERRTRLTRPVDVPDAIRVRLEKLRGDLPGLSLGDGLRELRLIEAPRPERPRKTRERRDRDDRSSPPRSERRAH